MAVGIVDVAIVLCMVQPTILELNGQSATTRAVAVAVVAVVIAVAVAVAVVKDL